MESLLLHEENNKPQSEEHFFVTLLTKAYQKHVSSQVYIICNNAGLYTSFSFLGGLNKIIFIIIIIIIIISTTNEVRWMLQTMQRSTTKRVMSASKCSFPSNILKSLGVLSVDDVIKYNTLRIYKEISSNQISRQEICNLSFWLTLSSKDLPSKELYYTG